MFSRLMQLWIPKRPSKATLFEMTCSKFITNSASLLPKSNIKGYILKYWNMYDLVGSLSQNWLENQKPTIPNYQNPKTTKTTSRQAKGRICSKTMSMGASLSGDAVNAWSSCSVPAPAKRWKVQRRPNNDVTKEPTKVDQASWFGMGWYGIRLLMGWYGW